MIFNLWANLKGLVYLIGGFATILYLNGWFQASLYYVVLAGALAAFVYGFIVTDAWIFFKNLIDGFRKNDNQKP